MADAEIRSAPAVYFDGMTAARHAVTVTCAPSGVEIRDAAGNPVADWLYIRLAQLNAPAHLFRIGLRDSDRLARIEIEDRALAHAIDLACPHLDRTDARARAERRGAVFWSLGAIASLLLVALYGVPRIADQLGRLLPLQIEQHLGRAGDVRFRAAFDKGHEAAVRMRRRAG